MESFLKDFQRLDLKIEQQPGLDALLCRGTILQLNNTGHGHKRATANNSNVIDLPLLSLNQASHQV